MIEWNCSFWKFTTTEKDTKFAHGNPLSLCCSVGNNVKTSWEIMTLYLNCKVAPSGNAPFPPSTAHGSKMSSDDGHGHYQMSGRRCQQPRSGQDQAVAPYHQQPWHCCCCLPALRQCRPIRDGHQCHRGSGPSYWSSLRRDFSCGSGESHQRKHFSWKLFWPIMPLKDTCDKRKFAKHFKVLTMFQTLFIKW